MNRRSELAERAAIAAMRLRKTHGFELWQALCVYDLAEEKLGIRVRFDDVPSMEGMYVEDNPPRIVLSSLRPPGRMGYTCAHEVGHHVFGHGTQVDEQIENETDSGVDREEERIAECFAGFLLMPKLAVSHAFAERGWDVERPNPEQVYVVAGWLGVGYVTLITHMRNSLRILSRGRAEELSRITLGKLRESIVHKPTRSHVVVVDQQWHGRPIDVQVGDVLLFRESIGFEGNCIRCLGHTGTDQFFEGALPGIARCWSKTKKWAQFVRVSRKNYIGQSRYRHLEEPTDA